jgi:hypothetical protein
MKIIDKKKDYYDFLAGVYGMDEMVVYDRRGSVVVNSEKVLLDGMDYYFSPKILFFDKPLVEKIYWDLKGVLRLREAASMDRSLRKTWKEGGVYHFILEVGRIHYRFEVERWIENGCHDSAHVEYRLIDTLRDVVVRHSDVPMCIIPCQVEYRWWTNEEQWKASKQRVNNPILAGTFIPKLISPSEIWSALYEYLSSLNDKPIIDTRSDIQKLESAGFDKKTSFRNVK